MKNLNLINNALTIVSTLTAEQIETVAKQSPEALLVYRETECGRTVDFAVSYDKKSDFGSVAQSGITFPGTDKDGHVLVTVLIPANVKKEDYIYDKYAVALNQLAIVEGQVVEALKTNATTKATFVKNITVLDADVGEDVDLGKGKGGKK